MIILCKNYIHLKVILHENDNRGDGGESIEEARWLGSVNLGSGREEIHRLRFREAEGGRALVRRPGGGENFGAEAQLRGWDTSDLGVNFRSIWCAEREGREFCPRVMAISNPHVLNTMEAGTV